MSLFFRVFFVSAFYPDLPSLKTLDIGFNCFSEKRGVMKLFDVNSLTSLGIRRAFCGYDSLEIQGCRSLTSIVIQDYCFNGNDNQTLSLHDLPVLKSVEVRDICFVSFVGVSIENNPSLELMTFENECFSQMKGVFTISNNAVFKHLLVSRKCFCNFIPDWKSTFFYWLLR